MKRNKEKNLKKVMKLIRKLCYDGSTNCIDLSGLNFEDLLCDVDISNMTVWGNLFQDRQTVKGGILSQQNQTVYDDLLQGHQTVGGNLYQEQDSSLIDGEIVDYD